MGVTEGEERKEREKQLTKEWLKISQIWWEKLIYIPGISKFSR